MKVRIPKTTKKQDQIIKEAVIDEMKNHTKSIMEDMIIQMLYVLHFEFGFGQKRLEKFAEFLGKEQSRLMEHYELSSDDVPFLCKQKLTEDGIDLDKFI